jgi:hypothetical protein
MNKILSAAAVLAVVTVPSVAEVRYDRNLEKAAMEIVASKMGDLRGGFSYAQKPQLVVRQGEARRAVDETDEQSAIPAPQGSPTNHPPSITTF